MRRKKKLRIKKKPIFFILIIFLIFGSILIIKKTTFKTNKEIKLNELNNIDKEITYFDYKKLDRYIKYKQKNKSLSNKEVVMDVNIGIDRDYYTHTKPSKNLNTTIILVNKYNYLKKNYIPKNLKDVSLKYSRSDMKLVGEAKEAYEKMAYDAYKQKYRINAISSYRSYNYQVNLYNRYKQKDGIDAADKYSARAGYSEHQTGLAIDIDNGKVDFNNFESTKEFKWMIENAYKYGFILRFPKDKEKQTGYQYEPWHYRYVGKKQLNICIRIIFV